jgi:4-amino-4-deoxy-L-arabinose transferase-like glycosyltransferase
LVIAYDLKQHDWLSFLYDTYRQVYWPPLHSWFTGIAFLIAGTGTVTARTVSLIAYIIAAVLLYLTANQMRQQKREIAGIVASTLFLTSPGLVPLAAKSMLEIPGLLAIILTFLIYFKLINNGSPPRKYIILGLGITFTYFVKTNYGILLILTFIIIQLIEARFLLRNLLTPYNFYTALPMFIIFMVWFAYPPKLIITWNALVNQPSGFIEPYGIKGLLFYPQAILTLSGSIWLFSLLIFSLFAAFKFRHNIKVRLLLVIVITQLLIGQLHHTKTERHILPIMPALFLLTGFVIAELWNHYRERERIIRFWLPSLLTGALLLYAITIFTTSLHTPPPNFDDEVISGIIAKEAHAQGTSLIIGTRYINHPNPPNLDWYLITKEQLITPTQASSFIQIEKERRIASTLIRHAPAWLIDSMLPVFTRSERPGTNRSLYLGFPPNTGYSRSQANFDSFLQDTFIKNPFDRIVVVTSLTNTARFPLTFIQPSLEKAGFHHLSTQKFGNLDMRIDTYKK